jgi:quercetin dioxygenase-like cupin family protein
MSMFKTEGSVVRTRMPWKLMLVGAFVACAFGGFAMGIAWATNPVGLTTTFIVGPTPAVLDEFQVVSQSPDHGVIMKTRGQSDVYVVKNTIVPGGHTGWHSHPGPSIVSVVSGQATEYRSDDPNGTVYSAGTAFADEGGDHAHIVVNEGTTDLVLIAFQILPKGATRRIDKPAP